MDLYFLPRARDGHANRIYESRHQGQNFIVVDTHPKSSSLDGADYFAVNDDGPGADAADRRG